MDGHYLRHFSHAGVDSRSLSFFLIATLFSLPLTTLLLSLSFLFAFLDWFGLICKDQSDWSCDFDHHPIKREYIDSMEIRSPTNHESNSQLQFVNRDAADVHLSYFLLHTKALTFVLHSG